MKSKLFLYTGLLGAMLSVGADRLYAGDEGSVNIASYRPAHANAVTGTLTSDRMALRKIFHRPEFNVIDPLDEFSGRDWNRLAPLGATVTHEMRETRESAAAKAGATFEEEARAGLY